jgi:hypothetical protein
VKENTEERISKPHKTQRTLGKHPTTKQNKQKALVPTTPTTRTMQIDPLRERERERERERNTDIQRNTRTNENESQNSTTLASKLQKQKQKQKLLNKM